MKEFWEKFKAWKYHKYALIGGAVAVVVIIAIIIALCVGGDKPAEPTTPTTEPSSSSSVPTSAPTGGPTSTPTSASTGTPSSNPTGEPTIPPTSEPTSAPTGESTGNPTTPPVTQPTVSPTSPATQPTVKPTTPPTTEPTGPAAPLASADQMKNVAVEKVSSAGGAVTAHPGGRITYKIFITNNNSDAISVNVTDTLPSGTVLVNGCDNANGSQLSWNVKRIEPGKTYTITYNASPNYTIKQVRESKTDIILKNTAAKVMDKTVPAPTGDIWVLETFNATDIRRMETGINALIAANLNAKNSAGQNFNGATLISQMYGVGFSSGVSIASPTNTLKRVFEIAGNSSASADDLAKAAKLIDMMVPSLYGGTTVPASKDSLYRGDRAKSVTLNDLISGDVIYVGKGSSEKIYIVNGTTLVEVGSDQVVINIDPATILPNLTAADRYVVIRPSINLKTSYSIQEDEYFNDADKSEYSELEKALIATAEAYWLRGDRLQYDTSIMSQHEFRKEPLIRNPEDYTVDGYGYLDCSTFTYDLHWVTYGYAAKATGSNGSTKAYNLCANILDCMSVGWNKETMKGSNKSAILYYERKASYTDAEKETIQKQSSNALRPGDLIVYTYADGSGGHIMAYVGRGLLIHCTGNSFPKGGTHDSHEASIRCMNVDDLFDPAIYSHGYLFTMTSQFGVVRPQNLTTPKITENTKNRIANMQGIVAEKVSSTAMGKTVNPGDEITYTFYVYNANDTAKTVAIKDVLSQYVTFVSATNGGSVSGSNISWNLNVPANTRVSVSYTVKVKSDVTAYTSIDGGKATVGGVLHKCYNTYVANTLTTAQQQTLINAVNTVKDTDRTGMDTIQVAKLIYKTAFGVDDLFDEEVTSLGKLIGNITDDNSRENIGVFNDTNYWSGAIVSLMDRNPSKAARMVAPGLYGGTYVYSSKYQDEGYSRYKTMGGTTLRSRYFWEKDLVVGDLYFLKGSSASYFYIYVGNNTLVNLTNMQEYDAREWLQRTPDTSKWHYYAVLRPSIVCENI